MARQTTIVVTSDLSRETIPEDKAATMTISFADGCRNSYKLDISEEEAEPFVLKGTEKKRRGPKTRQQEQPQDELTPTAPFVSSLRGGGYWRGVRTGDGVYSAISLLPFFTRRTR